MNQTDYLTEVNAIDWRSNWRSNWNNSSTANERNPDYHDNLYEFIATVAELLPDPQAWNKFTAAFRHYEKSRSQTIESPFL